MNLNDFKNVKIGTIISNKEGIKKRDMFDMYIFIRCLKNELLLINKFGVPCTYSDEYIEDFIITKNISKNFRFNKIYLFVISLIFKKDKNKIHNYIIYRIRKNTICTFPLSKRKYKKSHFREYMNMNFK